MRRVLRDLEDGYVTVEDARTHYGVVVDAETTAIDEDATERLRAERREK